MPSTPWKRQTFTISCGRADQAKSEAISAGTEPGSRVHPEVLAVMQEIGIDLLGATPQELTEELAREAQLLVTMGCGDKCPYVPGLRRDDWPLRDPKGLPVEEGRAVLDEVKHRVQSLIEAENLGQ
jgi:arsenate reductase